MIHGTPAKLKQDGEKLNCLESNKHDFLNSIRKMTKASHYWHIYITDYENAPLQRSINWWSNGNTVYIRQKKLNIFETVFLYFSIRCNWKGLFDLYRCVHFQSCMLMCGHQRAFFASYHSEGWESTKAFAKDYGRYSNIWVNFHNHDPSHKIFPNSLSIELINSDLSSQNKSLRNSWAEQWSLKQPRKGYFVMRAFKTKGFLLAAL